MFLVTEFIDDHFPRALERILTLLPAAGKILKHFNDLKGFLVPTLEWPLKALIAFTRHEWEWFKTDGF